MVINVARSARFNTYHGTHDHFWSAQCIECFSDIPALITGTELISDIRSTTKCRKLRLANRNASDIDRVRRHVGETIEKTSVIVEKTSSRSEYDLRKTIFSQIEAMATGRGLAVQRGAQWLQTTPLEAE